MGKTTCFIYLSQYPHNPVPVPLHKQNHMLSKTQLYKINILVSEPKFLKLILKRHVPTCSQMMTLLTFKH